MRKKEEPQSLFHEIYKNYFEMDHRSKYNISKYETSTRKHRRHFCSLDLGKDLFCRI